MNILELVNKLAEEKVKLYMIITGGGTGAITRLLENGGASSFFVGAEVPYSYTIDNEPTPDKFCSKEYAELLCQKSLYNIGKYFQRPKDITISDLLIRLLEYKFIGVGVTASLMKNEGERPERVNEAFITINFKTYHMTYDKTQLRTRLFQEDELSNDILCCIQDFINNEYKFTNGN